MIELNKKAVLDLKIRTQSWHNIRHYKNKIATQFHNIWNVEKWAPGYKTTYWWMTRDSVLEKSRPTPFTDINPADFKNTIKRYRVFWLGHSSVLIQFKKLTILTDPVFSDRVSPISFIGPRRFVKLPVKPDGFVRLDVVLISHNHYDHLDQSSVLKLKEKYDPLFIVPLNMKRLLLDWGIIRVVELDWHQYLEFSGIRFNCTPAKHFANRGLTDRNEMLWSGWMIEDIENSGRIFFAGDTGYASLFKEIREKFGAPDLALLPIGAYLPRWIMREVHLSPAEALKAFADLGAKHFIGIHWGCFELSDELMHEPLEITQRLARITGIADRVHILPVGGAFEE